MINLESGIEILNRVSPQPSTSDPRPKRRSLNALEAFNDENPLIIGFGHKRGSGKDTAGEYICKNYGARRIAFADPIKVGTMVLYGMTKEQAYGSQKEEIDDFWNVSPGILQQLEGTDLHRDKLADLLPESFGDGNIWVRMAERRIRESSDAIYVITDVRFPNEAKKIQEMGGLVVRVDCDFETRMKRIGDDPENPSRDDDHVSETALDDFVGWDFILDNNGSMDHLQKGIETILERSPVETGLKKGSVQWRTDPEVSLI